MGRSGTVIKNTIWEMGYYLVVIILGFLAPRYIILTYGSEVNGLSSTITQILNIILILQAGATTASVYALFKPVAEQDQKGICQNIASAEDFFHRVSWIFAALLLVVAVFTPLVLDSSLEKKAVFAAFILMGAKSFVDLYYTAKFRIVFTVYEQKFYLSIATLLEQVIYYLLVFLTIFLKAHFLWMYVWFFVGCMIKVVYLKVCFWKKHPELVTKKYRGNGNKIRGRNYALANEVAHSVMGSSVTIVLSLLYGLEEASVYSVYALVSQALSLVSTAVYSSFAPSFGGLIAQEHSEHAARIFSIFQYLYLMLNTFMMMCMSILVVPFVKLYVSGVGDVDYANGRLAAVLVFGGLFSAYRIPYNVVVSTGGYFKETWLQPVVTAVLCILLSVGLGMADYALILLGPAVFYMINFFYQYVRLKPFVPWLICSSVWRLLVISLTGVILTIFAGRFLILGEGVVGWITSAAVSAFFSLSYIGLLSLLLVPEELKQSLLYVRKILRK